MSKDKKIRKLAVIRSDEHEQCPFGLPITESCEMVHDAVEKMAPLDILGDKATEEEKQKLINANKRLFRWRLMHDGTEPNKCIYADQIFDEKEKVNCNYGGTGEGISQEGTLLGSPFYSQVFSGVGLDSLYSIPWGYSFTPNVTNLYYAMRSLQGSDKEKLKDLIRLADFILEHKIRKYNEGIGG